MPIGDFQGADYRRNAFAAGTGEEVRALLAMTGLGAGDRVLDVGCGDARHLRSLAARGVGGTGVDVSSGLVAAGRAAVAREATMRDATTTDAPDVELLVGDARDLDAVLGDRAGRYDAVWSLCQGALGTSPEADPEVVGAMARAVRRGGLVVCTFFHALFAARHLAPGDALDTVHLTHHQVSEVHGPDHARRRFDLWTAAYTVREALRLVTDAGLEVRAVRGVEPGAYDRRDDGEVAIDDPEVLVVARRPR